MVSLRCAGYCQAAFLNWFSEPEGWMEQRIAEHKRIRDDLMEVINRCPRLLGTSFGGRQLSLPAAPAAEGRHLPVCQALPHQANVTVTPGTEFGKQYDNFVRMNFSQDHDKAVSAVERICKMVEEVSRMSTNQNPIPRGSTSPPPGRLHDLYGWHDPKKQRRVDLFRQGQGGGAAGDLSGRRPSGRCKLSYRCRNTLAEGEQIQKLLYMTVYINGEAGFSSHAKLADFASEYLVEELGEAGIGSRAAIGIASLPGEAPVEVQMVLMASEPQ